MPIFILLVVLYYKYNPADKNWHFPSCPTWTIFHIYCPGCGTQRAIHYLLHGELQKAFRYNPLLVCISPLMMILVAQYLYESFSGKRWYIPIFNNAVFLYAVFFLFLAYFIVRNLPLEDLGFLKPPAHPL